MRLVNQNLPLKVAQGYLGISRSTLYDLEKLVKGGKKLILPEILQTHS